MGTPELIAILALAVAVYNVLPRSRRLTLRLHWRWLDWALLTIVALAVHYLLFYPQVEALGLADQWRFFMEPSDVAYFVTLLGVVLIALHLRSTHLAPTQARALANLVRTLLLETSHAELVSLLSRHFRSIVQLARRDFPIVRLRSMIDPTNLMHDNATQRAIRRVTAPQWLGRILHASDAARTFVTRLLPARKREQALMLDTLTQLSFSRSFVRDVALTYPDFGLVLFSQRLPGCWTFIDTYMRELLRNPSSALYIETQTVEKGSSSLEPQSGLATPILDYFFSDAAVARDASIWKPIGDEMLDQLRAAHTLSTDPYNLPLDNAFREKGRPQSSYFVAVRFFDHMVEEALQQGITWHMWLYYFPHFTESILANFHVDAGSNEYAKEFPNRYSYLLYEMISTMRSWILRAEHLPADQENIVLESEQYVHENGNIPKSSIFALAACFKQILLSEVVPSRFKQDMAEIVFDLYHQLRSTERLEHYGRALLNALAEQGSSFINSLRSHWDEYENTFRAPDHVREFEEKLDIPRSV